VKLTTHENKGRINHFAARLAESRRSSRGSRPIWELTSDQARRTAIHQAYKRKAAKEFTPEILNVTSDVRAHPDMRVVVPEGYKLLCGGALDNWKGSANMLTASFPESDNTWRGSGKDHVDGDPANISAFALAVYDPDDIWEARIFQSRPSSTSAHPEQEVGVDPGYVMVWGGAWVDRPIPFPRIRRHGTCNRRTTSHQVLRGSRLTP